MEFSSSSDFSRHTSRSVPDRRSRSDNLFDDIEDDDDRSVISQSPYFTQPTQIVEQPTLKKPPVAMSSPRSIVEVPASSPFKPQSTLSKGGRLANFMAPAGTAFKAPIRQPVKREYIMISDDELDNPTYSRDDSSDDGKPARGDIRPSSFRPKGSKMFHGAATAERLDLQAVRIFFFERARLNLFI